MLRSRRALLLISLAALAAAPPPATLAHMPPSPNPDCSDGTDGNGGALPHDFLLARAQLVGMGFEVPGGLFVAFAIDGATFLCAVEDLCPDGHQFIVIDPSQDDLPDGTDPSGDDIVVMCDEAPAAVRGIQVPRGDGEYEFGFGGAFLPEAHHNPPANGYYVEALYVDGGFAFGSDGDGDGDIGDGSGDCLERRSSAGAYTTQCPAGADGGWWMFAECEAAAANDWTFTTDGALLRPGLGDNDGDDIPNSLEDDDSDGLPNGLDSDNPNDDFVNTNWNPTLTPGTLPPDASASCLLAGHVNDGPAPPPVACADGLDNDGDGSADWLGDLGCLGPWDESEEDDVPPAPSAAAPIRWHKAFAKLMLQLDPSTLMLL